MKQVKSILIDELLHNNNIQNTTTEINGKWYIARPQGTSLWIKRFRVAWRVFTGKSIAFHFKSDE